MPSDDRILIDSLELSSRIGITPEERANPQRLTVSLDMAPRHDLVSLGDDLKRTVDYHAVCEAVKALAATGERNLVETLATDLCDVILQRFAVTSVTVELRKYILPDTRFVAVRLQRPL